TKLPWLVAILLTLCFWSAYFVTILLGARDGTGANIGIGLIMLLSPFVIGVGAWVAAERSKNRS
ncbi:MAG: hypothetical protein ACREBM_01390, partial [Sphingomicrobium sp.]